MKTLNYISQFETFDFDITIRYKKMLPQFISQLAEKSLENYQTKSRRQIASEKAANNYKSIIENYLEISSISLDSGIYLIIAKAFEDFEELFNGNKEELSKAIANNFLWKEEHIGGKVISLSPLVEKFILKIDGKNFNLDSEEEIKHKILTIFSNQNQDILDPELINYKKNIQEKTEQKINLTIANNTLKCMGNQINSNMLNYDEIIKQNNLKIENIENQNTILDDYQFLTNNANVSFELKEINNYYFSFLIKDQSFDFTYFINWNDLTLFKNKIIREKDFIQESDIYQNMLAIYLEDKIEINHFMFLAFLKNEREIQDKLLQDQDNLKKIIDDKDVLRNILLLDNDFKLTIPFNLDYARKIIQSASLKQIPIILRKISEATRDKMLDLKLINRLASIEITYLAPKQKELFENEKQKKEFLKKEYFKVIGQITQLGVRERIKNFNKDEWKKMGGKKTNQWLNKNIGHNKGNIVIDVDKLKKAKKILEDFNEIIKKEWIKK